MPSKFPVQRLRALQPDKVAEIAASMRDLGRQLQPIMVRLRPGEFHIKKYLLVAGLHRIEARKKNDEKTILATIIDVDAKAAELVEIDETRRGPISRRQSAKSWLSNASRTY